LAPRRSRAHSLRFWLHLRRPWPTHAGATWRGHGVEATRARRLDDMAVLDICAELAPEELNRAIAATAEVLVEYGEGDRPVPFDLMDMPASAAVHVIAADFAPLGVELHALLHLLDDPKTAKALALYVVGRLREQALVRDLVEHRYTDEGRAAPGFDLQHNCVTLIVLAVRVTRVQAGMHACEFRAQADEVKTLISSLSREQR
jgi:hypothetical protein